MRPGVRYYCPIGVPKPAHRDDLPPGGAELLPGKGPDATLGQGEGGGTVFGGIYVDAEPGWVRTAAKWWVNLGTTVPQHLARAATHPRIMRWSLIVGALPEHRWRIPVLVAPQGGADDAEPVYVSALEREWRGDTEGWQAPRELAAVQERLIQVAHDLVAASDISTQTREVTDLALEILSFGHLVSRHEIAAGGWLTEMTMLRVLTGACGHETPA